MKFISLFKYDLNHLLDECFFLNNSSQIQIHFISLTKVFNSDLWHCLWHDGVSLSGFQTMSTVVVVVDVVVVVVCAVVVVVVEETRPRSPSSCCFPRWWRPGRLRCCCGCCF